ncbi:MAG: tetratricopeptide repeat protein [Aquificae bacterium]|nr:tetratricopeptide repeat protein [Aquificota bacterium]
MDKKEKKKLPIEENVDIEFEYKVYMLYDKLKKHKGLVVLGVVLFFALIFGGYFYKKHKESLLNRSSVIAYQIEKAYLNKEYEKAEKLINQLKKEYPNSPFVKLAEGYSFLIKKEKEKVSPTDADKLEQILSTKHLKGVVVEYKGYLYYTDGKYQQTLSTIQPIDQRYSNYISALTLKGFTYKKIGKTEEAKQVFSQVLELSPYEYFKLIAKENL